MSTNTDTDSTEQTTGAPPSRHRTWPRAPQRHDIRWRRVAPLSGDAIAWLVRRIGEGRARMRQEPDAGYSTEAVLVTALLVGLAIAVIAIIVIKVTDLANSITLG